MNPRSIFYFAVSIVFACSCITLRAEDQLTLKTEYYEAAVNGAKAVNYKRWNTSRDGKLILTHEQRDLMQNGTFVQTDTVIFQDGKKLLHFFTLNGKRTCFYHPEAGYTVAQSDSDGDGRYDRIIITETKGKIMEYLDIKADGTILPISDAQLKAMQEALNKFSDGMKKFK